MTTHSPSAHPHQVPITDSGYLSALMVPIRVGDKIYRALVDTGASESLISSRLTKESSVVGRISTQTGELAIKLNSVDMGTAGDDRSNPEIFIGMDILANQIVEVDLKSRNVRFLPRAMNGVSKPGEPSAASRKTKQLKIRRDEELRPVADFWVAGESREFLIDTGHNSMTLARVDVPSSFCSLVTSFDGTELVGKSLVPVRLQNQTDFAIVGSRSTEINVIGLNQLTNSFARFDFKAGTLDYVPYEKSERSALIMRDILSLRSLDGFTFGSSSTPVQVWEGSNLETKQEILRQIQGLTTKSIERVRGKIPSWRATAKFNNINEKLVLPRADDTPEATSPPPGYEPIKGYCWTWFAGNGWFEHARDSGCKERNRCWPYTAADLESGKWPRYGLAILIISGKELALSPGKSIFPPGTTFKYLNPKSIKTDASSGHHIVTISE